MNLKQPPSFIRRIFSRSESVPPPSREEMSEDIEAKSSEGDEPSEEAVRFHAYLLAESDGFVESPETYWTCAEKALRYVQSYGSHADEVRVVSLRLQRTHISHKL